MHQGVWACMAVVLLLQATTSDSLKRTKQSHHNETSSKRNFSELLCNGVYDKNIFARLNRICQDCSNLRRAPELFQWCRDDCFTTLYFKQCMDALIVDRAEVEQITTWIHQLRGFDLGFG